MIPALILAAALHLANGHGPCVAPATQSDRITCGDAELRALAKASLIVGADIARTRHQPLWVVAEDGWPAKVEACASRDCIEDAYSVHLGILSESEPLHLPGAVWRSAPTQAPRGWALLATQALGEGWYLYWLDVGFSQGTRADPQPDRTGHAIGVVHMDRGKGVTGDDAAGLRFETTRRGDWRVIQVGECACGHLIRLDGLYAQRPRKARP